MTRFSEVRRSGGAGADANFDAYGCRMRSLDAESDARAVANAGWHRDADGMMYEGIARAAAWHAGIRPHLAPASALRTCTAHRDSQGQRGTEERFAPGNGDLSSQQAWFVDAVIVHEGVANARDDVADRRKVDRCFIGEAVVGCDLGRLGPNDPVHTHVITLSQDAARPARCQDHPRLVSIALHAVLSDDTKTRITDGRASPEAVARGL